MIKSIIRHEIKMILRNPKTWYCLALVQILLALIFNWLMTNFIKSQAFTQAPHYGITEEVLHPFYAWFGLLVLVLLPLLSTQLLSAEKQRGTMINYYCAPVTAMQVICGKFLSLNILLFLLLAFISIMPVSIVISGALDWGQYTATLIGLCLMLAAASAFCLSLAAFMAGIVRPNLLILIALASFILLEWAAQYASSYAMFLQGFGLLQPLKHFLAGIVSIRGAAYYLLIAFGCLCIGSWGYTRRWQA